MTDTLRPPVHTDDPEYAANLRRATLASSVGSALEYFDFGRLDADVSLGVSFADDRGLFTIRAIAQGIGVAPRWLAAADLRLRFGEVFYVLAQGGTVFFPSPGIGLVRGVFAAVGMGLDFGP